MYVVVVGYALTILRRCYGVSICGLVERMEVDGGSPVSEAVGDNDGRGVPPQGWNDQCCFAGHGCGCGWGDGLSTNRKAIGSFNVSEGNIG